MDTIAKFLLGIVLICMAQIILGITVFNESFIFADPGIMAPKASNLGEWFMVARQNSKDLIAAISPFNTPYSASQLIYAGAFASPPFAILLWWSGKQLHIAILLALTLLLLLDISNMLEFNGNNSANGGYDGLGEFACYGLHLLLGAFCVFLVAGRLFYVGYVGVSKFIREA